MMHASGCATTEATPATGAADAVIRTLRTAAEWRAASALYRDVFGYTAPEYALTPTLLAALTHNGGTVLGAFDDDRLVAFCYGFTGIHDGSVYHYSQATAVAPAAQGRHLGRTLKHAQADAARTMGVHEMRWAFDPYALRNAHFNLAVLGAVAFRFHADMYDTGSSDRLIARWRLDDDAPAAHGIPTDEIVVAAGRTHVSPGARDRVRSALTERFAAGMVLTDVTRRGADAVAYRFQTESAA